MKAKIQVGIRLRPFLDTELSKGYQNSKIKTDSASNQISIQSANGGNRVFEFDHVLGPSTTQDSLYDDCKITELVTRVLDGFHSTIFAYGQTGSGKTFTMEGKHDGNGTFTSPETKGIVARVFDDLFTQITTLKSQNNKAYNVTCSFLQIYNEKIYDLLSQFSAGAAAAATSTAAAVAAPLPQGLKLRWNPREQFQVENLFVFDVKTPKEATSYFLQGIKNRVTASHKLNMTSSRSHTIFTITVHAYTAEGAHETSSKMQLVDLAGSERIALTGTEGKTAKESIDINKSLFTLRQVITALSEINQPNNSFNQTNTFNSTSQHHQHSPDSRPSSKQQQLLQTTTLNQSDKHQHHIPYRESKLTSLLKQSIGGNCYCLMVACIVPNDPFADENLSTLHYATRATYIKNKPIKNEDPNKQKISDLVLENSSLKEELDKANAHIAFLTQELKKSEKKVVQSKTKCRCSAEDDVNGNTSVSSQQQQALAAAAAEDPFAKEQSLLAQHQEQFKSQRSLQLQHSKNMEEKMMRMSRQFRETEMATTHTNFVQTHQLRSSSMQSATNLMQPHLVLEANNKLTEWVASTKPLQKQPGVATTAADYENFSERLIESITLVRSLLESNKDLRQQTDECKSRMREQEIELEQLIAENQSLQEKLDEYSSSSGLGTAKTNQHATMEHVPPPLSRESSKDESRFRSSVAAKMANSKPTTSLDFRGHTKNELIQEILELRQNYKLLENRMKSIDISDRSPLGSSSIHQPTFKKPSMNSTALSGRSNVFQSLSTSKKRVTSLQYPPSRGSIVSNSVQIPIHNHNNEHHLALLDQTRTISNNQDINNSSSNFANKQSTDSVPTIFGKYTFYQSNFQNIDDIQSSTISQQKPPISNSELIKQLQMPSGKSSRNGSIADLESSTNMLLSEVNSNHVKARVGQAPPLKGKQQRSTSMTKQQQNLQYHSILTPNSNGNSSGNSTSHSNNHSSSKGEQAFVFYQGINIPSSTSNNSAVGKLHSLYLHNQQQFNGGGGGADENSNRIRNDKSRFKSSRKNYNQ